MPNGKTKFPIPRRRGGGDRNYYYYYYYYYCCCCCFFLSAAVTTGVRNNRTRKNSTKRKKTNKTVFYRFSMTTPADVFPLDEDARRGFRGRNGTTGRGRCPVAIHTTTASPFIYNYYYYLPAHPSFPYAVYNTTFITSEYFFFHFSS